ncbi:AMP-dependent synthetase/ligase [Roseospirillum parvum]|uniref:Long-chain acyl-CoA synthetase n=1 Tax=Roseospirillum parvum TaxID=83401 RepID=A0A1G7XM29_9PROT|nr:long-chain fatty acid--CoA ligase [Roseospirillum parvum]SDG85254.1 long-chain acyl-CoA synthetase [Roseospirillum parvum]
MTATPPAALPEHAVDCRACDSLLDLFRRQVARHPERPLISQRRQGRWQAQSWGAVAEQVDHLAAGLVAQGARPGQRVLLLSENRPEWLIADLAIMSAGGITTPAYVTHTVDDLVHLLSDSGAEIAIASTAALGARLLAALPRATACRTVILIEPVDDTPPEGVRALSWEAVLKAGEGQPRPASEAGLKRTDTACIIYTSGTGGAPKGVMTSHGAILHNCHGAQQVLNDLGLDDEIFLSFLPLSHAYEHTAGQFFPMSVAAHIHYAESVEKLAGNMLEVRPTIMTAVPRLYELLRQRTLSAMAQQGRVKRWLFQLALALGRRRLAGPLPPYLIPLDRLLDRLVRAKVAARFGGRLKALVSGGAPLTPEVGEFFTALGMRLLQGYGQTETGPVVSVNPPGRVRLDAVGPPLVDTRVRIAEDGEILVAGELVMQGYWNNPEATRAALDAEGWVHTGDIGRLEADGHLAITDRKKDIIVNSGGDNIAPQRVESALTLEREIGQAMVDGDRRPHLVALLVPDPGWLAELFGDDLPEDPEEVAADPTVRAGLEAAVKRANGRLQSIEKVRRFAIIGDPFSVDNGLLTPTMKIRRHAIRAAHGPRIEALYR